MVTTPTCHFCWILNRPWLENPWVDEAVRVRLLDPPPNLAKKPRIKKGWRILTFKLDFTLRTWCPILAAMPAGPPCIASIKLVNRSLLRLLTSISDCSRRIWTYKSLKTHSMIWSNYAQIDVRITYSFQISTATCVEQRGTAQAVSSVDIFPFCQKFCNFSGIASFSRTPNAIV